MRVLVFIFCFCIPFEIFAIEPCQALSEGVQKRDGVCSFEDAAHRAEQVFGYVLSLKEYCDDGTQLLINSWYKANKELIVSALTIRNRKLEAVVEVTNAALWKNNSKERLTSACLQTKRELRNSSRSYFDGRVREYLREYVPNKSLKKDK